jgi:hypothetical protein
MIIRAWTLTFAACIGIGACAAGALAIPPHKVLFDATKAEMAGSADWVIDADTRNVGTGTGGAMTVGAGSDSNPARFPNPAQSGITAATAETYWSGALSSWGVAAVKQGMAVETLPIGGRITFNDSTNVQDLSNYSVFVVDEPNIAFTAAEKTAIISWVNAGGGLFMISDHTGSDRNNDGIDSVGVWNGLLNSNATGGNPFGITINSDNLSAPISTFVDTVVSDPIIHGPAGVVAQMNYHNGASITISTTQNSSVRGAIWTTASHTNTNVMVAYATYGQGRVVAVGDSSPFDDGTGDPGDSLFNGWSGEANGDHGKLAINATVWLDNPPPTCVHPSVAAIHDQSVPDGSPVTITAAATGTATLSYQWRRNLVALTNGASISGATSASLVINPARVGDRGTYDLVVTNTCGTTTSNTATLVVLCRPDFDANGSLTVSDIFAFLNAWFAGDPAADFNAVGGLTIQDIFDFLNAWFVGCA